MGAKNNHTSEIRDVLEQLRLEAEMRGKDLMHPILEAWRAGATMGEIGGAGARMSDGLFLIGEPVVDGLHQRHNLVRLVAGNLRGPALADIGNVALKTAQGTQTRIGLDRGCRDQRQCEKAERGQDSDRIIAPCPRISWRWATPVESSSTGRFSIASHKERERST